MLTLAAAAPNGQVNLMLGAGELKQAKPYGWRRSEGLDRLEGHFKLFNMLLTCDAPFDFEGNTGTRTRGWGPLGRTGHTSSPWAVHQDSPGWIDAVAHGPSLPVGQRHSDPLQKLAS